MGDIGSACCCGGDFYDLAFPFGSFNPFWTGELLALGASQDYVLVDAKVANYASDNSGTEGDWSVDPLSSANNYPAYGAMAMGEWIYGLLPHYASTASASSDQTMPVAIAVLDASTPTATVHDLTSYVQPVSVFTPIVPFVETGDIVAYIKYSPFVSALNDHRTPLSGWHGPVSEGANLAGVRDPIAAVGFATPAAVVGEGYLLPGAPAFFVDGVIYLFRPASALYQDAEPRLVPGHPSNHPDDYLRQPVTVYGGPGWQSLGSGGVTNTPVNEDGERTFWTRWVPDPEYPGSSSNAPIIPDPSGLQQHAWKHRRGMERGYVLSNVAQQPGTCLGVKLTTDSQFTRRDVTPIGGPHEVDTADHTVRSATTKLEFGVPSFTDYGYTTGHTVCTHTDDDGPATGSPVFAFYKQYDDLQFWRTAVQPKPQIYHAACNEDGTHGVAALQWNDFAFSDWDSEGVFVDGERILSSAHLNENLYDQKYGSHFAVRDDLLDYKIAHPSAVWPYTGFSWPSDWPVAEVESGTGIKWYTGLFRHAICPRTEVDAITLVGEWSYVPNGSGFAPYLRERVEFWKDGVVTKTFHTTPIVNNDFVAPISINDPLNGQFMSVADNHVYARLSGIDAYFSSTDSWLGYVALQNDGEDAFPVQTIGGSPQQTGKGVEDAWPVWGQGRPKKT